MLIEFEVKREVGDAYEDYLAGFVSATYRTRLTFTDCFVRFRYFGESHNVRESALQAVQAFLDGDIHEREIYQYRFDIRPGIHYGPMSPDVKNVIENAIALKTGRGERILPGESGAA